MKAGVVVVWLKSLAIGARAGSHHSGCAGPARWCECKWGGRSRTVRAGPATLRRQLRRMSSGRRRRNAAELPGLVRQRAGSRTSNLIVRTIRLGQGAMLAFPKLTDDEIAALATYIRNAWGNKFGAATADQVTTILAGLAKPDGPEGVGLERGLYAGPKQARRGALFGRLLALSRRAAEWRRSAGPAAVAGDRARGVPAQMGGPVGRRALHLCAHEDAARRTGHADRAARIDAIAHMFAVSNMPAGDKELPTRSQGALEAL